MNIDFNNLECMTVNERLSHLNLFGEFDQAIRMRQRAEAVEVLLKAKFTREQARETVEAIFSNPHRYGF